MGLYGPEEEDMKGKILALTLILLAVPLLAWGERYAFSAYLNGKAMVPPVKTEATAGARFDFTPDTKSMRFNLSLLKLNNATTIQIHLGAAGKEGPPVVTLYSSGHPRSCRKANCPESRRGG